VYSIQLRVDLIHRPSDTPSPDGHLLATGSADHTARLWDITDFYRPRQVATITHTGGVRSVAFSPDGHLLATGSADHTARLWDITNPNQPRPAGIITAHTAEVYTVAFSPDGHLLATGSADHTARLWDITNPNQPRPAGIITAHTAEVYTVAFSPDGRLLATGSADHTARLWDITNPNQPREVATMDTSSAVTGVAISPNGRTVAAAGFSYTFRRWDITTPSQPIPLMAVTEYNSLESTFRSVAFTPDNNTVLTTFGSWDVREPGKLLPAHPAAMFVAHTVAVDPTNRLWAGASPGKSKVALIGKLRPGELVVDDVEQVARLICERAYPRMTVDEWNQYIPNLPYQPPCP
jgi:WD40 repeat protein